MFDKALAFKDKCFSLMKKSWKWKQAEFLYKVQEYRHNKTSATNQTYKTRSKALLLHLMDLCGPSKNCNNVASFMSSLSRTKAEIKYRTSKSMVRKNSYGML